VKIFINYRRQTDEDNLVFAIANSLMREFGVENVFFDKQVIKAGSEFPREIDKALENCRIFIPVIGREWLKIMKKRQALEEPDYVLNEIEHALEKGVFVLPILLDNTSMPSEKDLPAKLSRMSLINAVNISSDPKQLPRDVKLLISELNDIFSRSPRKSGSSKIINFKKPGWIIGLIASLVVITVLAVIYFRKDFVEQKPVEQEKSEIPPTVKNNISDYTEQKPVESEKEKNEIPSTVKNNKTLRGKEVTDIDGNIYKTAVIGNELWMAENLKTTRYNDGTPIECPGENNDAWKTNTTGAYSWYSNNESISYGALYNWYAVGTGKLCPIGWHVPSHPEVDNLVHYAGGWKVAGGMLKEAGKDHWRSPNEAASNSTGFSALPGGFRDEDGDFRQKGVTGVFWSSTNFSKEYPERATSSDADLYCYHLHLEYYSAEAPRMLYKLNVGSSVRCIKDN